MGGGVGFPQQNLLQPAVPGITLADVAALLAKQRADDSADLDRRVAAQVASETKRIESAAQQQIDAVYAANDQGRNYAQSTPGPSDRIVGFATPLTPVVAGHGFIDLGDNNDILDEEDPEISAQLAGAGASVGVGVAAAQITALAAAAATKRDAKPHPMSFWQDRIEPPQGLGEGGRHAQTFVGKLKTQFS
jgi:hypothetical protein